MSERRKKAPKIAWRDLKKESDEATATPPAPPSAAEASAEVPQAPPAPQATAPGAADATSPSALAAKLDEAYAAMVADAAREQGSASARPDGDTTAPESPREPAPRRAPRPKQATAAKAAGGPPPDINIAPARATSVTVSARAGSPASTPAPTPEAEVQRILAHLATYVPVPRARAAAAAPSTAGDSPAPVASRGPMPLEQDVAPLISPAGLRDAARTRRGRVELLLFRAGGELFALPLGAVEEAIEAPAIHTLPEMPAAMLGVFNLRERLVPTYSPGPSLGVELAEPAGAALVVRSGERRMALAADDVEDVMELDLSTLREPPVVEDTDGILLGVARFSRDLVGVLDADALISACLGGRNVETS